jgi:hypothetical protein
MKLTSIRVKNRRDFRAGLMFIVAGSCFAIGATHYAFGSSARPGPGFFPFGLGILLALIGATIAGQSCVARSQEPAPIEPIEPIEPIAWRPLGVVVLGITTFGFTLPSLGITLALPLLVTIISAAGDQFRWKEVLANAGLLTLASWAIFVQGLGLMLPVWPWFMG